MNDGWRSSGISISWATNARKNLKNYEEARALDRQKALFVVKGGRSKDAAVAGLLGQSMTEGSKRKQQEMEMTEGTGHLM